MKSARDEGKAYPTKRLRDGSSARAKICSPKKLYSLDYDDYERGSQSNYKGSNFEYDRNAFSTMKGHKRVLEFSDTNLNNRVKYSRRPSLGSHEGYDKDKLGHPVQKKLYTNRDTTSSAMLDVLPDGFMENNMLPTYDSNTEEDSPIFDPLSDVVFEELCSLADDTTPLPDIFDKRVRPLETNFKYNQEDFERNSKQNTDKYVSFEKVLYDDKAQKSSSKTVQHKSEKAKALQKVSFKLSPENPEEYAKKTAYFGSGA